MAHPSMLRSSSNFCLFFSAGLMKAFVSYTSEENGLSMVMVGPWHWIWNVGSWYWVCVGWKLWFIFKFEVIILVSQPLMWTREKLHVIGKTRGICTKKKGKNQGKLKKFGSEGRNFSLPFGLRHTHTLSICIKFFFWLSVVTSLCFWVHCPKHTVATFCMLRWWTLNAERE